MSDNFGTTQSALDALLRSTVEKENRTREDFEKNYGFMKGPPTDIIKDRIPQMIDTSRPKVEDILPQKTEVEGKAEGIKVLPSPKPFPKTASAMIGWRGYSQYWIDMK